MGRRDGHLRLQGTLVLVRRDHGNEEHDPRRDGGGVRTSDRHCQLHGQKGMTDFREIAKIVVQYYQYPDETAKRVREEMGLPEAGIPKAVEAGGETVG